MERLEFLEIGWLPKMVGGGGSGVLFLKWGFLTPLQTMGLSKMEFHLSFSYDQNQVFVSLSQCSSTQCADDFLIFGFVKG